MLIYVDTYINTCIYIYVDILGLNGISSRIWYLGVSENGMGNFNREDDAPGDPGNPRWARHGPPCHAWHLANKNSEIHIPSQKWTLVKVEGPQFIHYSATNRLRTARNVDMTAPMDIPLAQTGISSNTKISTYITIYQHIYTYIYI